MIYDRHDGWVDVNPSADYRPPHLIVPAAEIAAAIRQGQDEWDIYMHDRKCIYTDDAGNKYPLVLEFRIATAALVTIGGGTEGHMIEVDDTVCEDAEVVERIAGMSLGAYFSQPDDDFEVNIALGDGYWTIRQGAVFANFTAAAVAAGQLCCCAAAGLVRASNAMPGPLAAEIQENLLAYQAIGVTTAVVGGGGGLAGFKLLLPPTYRIV